MRLYVCVCALSIEISLDRFFFSFCFIKTVLTYSIVIVETVEVSVDLDNLWKFSLQESIKFVKFDSSSTTSPGFIAKFHTIIESRRKLLKSTSNWDLFASFLDFFKNLVENIPLCCSVSKELKCFIFCLAKDSHPSSLLLFTTS